MNADGLSSSAPVRRFARLRHGLPLALFALLLVFLGIGLSLKPREVPSPLIGKPVPVFDLPAVEGRSKGLSNRDLVGQVSLVNVFASWCVACLQEHPLLVKLARSGRVPIHGLNYKDKPDEARAWLDRWGDPYARTAADLDGRVGIDWGVYGVPETFVVDKAGLVRMKHIGPLNEEAIRDKLEPLIKELGS